MSFESLPERGLPDAEAYSRSPSESELDQTVECRHMEQRLQKLAADLGLVDAAIKSPERREVSSKKIQELLDEYQQSGAEECHARITGALKLLLQEAKDLASWHQSSLLLARSQPTKDEERSVPADLAKLEKAIYEVEDLHARVVEAQVSPLPMSDSVMEELPSGEGEGRGGIFKGEDLPPQEEEAVGRTPPKGRHVWKRRARPSGMGEELSSFPKKRGVSTSPSREETAEAEGPSLKRSRAADESSALANPSDEAPKPEQMGSFRRTSRAVASAAGVVRDISASGSWLAGMNLRDRFQVVSAAVGGATAGLFSRSLRQGVASGLLIGDMVAREERVLSIVARSGGAAAGELMQSPEIQAAFTNPLPAMFPALQPVVGALSTVASIACFVKMGAEVPSWDRYQVAAGVIGGGVSFMIAEDPASAVQHGLYAGTYGGGVVRFVTTPIRWCASRPGMRDFVTKKLARSHGTGAHQ